ncbi:hypothetical protein JHK84_034146 [Glycine max]|nr:hypothetical protein JHK86_033890 [Glycine max]KAG5140378.1 hypothetical protein JHK84_034146 [Glycine max]
MPPEYAARGHFSMKSDVFSYGVILLEIVSGQRNREFSDPKHNLNLLGYAWRLWTEERALELLEGVLRERLTPSEVIRCIQVGLLCVQQRPEDRPDMSSVVLMLNGEKLLPNPNVPGFYTERAVTPESDIKPSKATKCLYKLPSLESNFLLLGGDTFSTDNDDATETGVDYDYVADITAAQEAWDLGTTLD